MSAGRRLRLLPAVFAAYALTVVPLAALGDDLLRQQHVLRAAVPHRRSVARLFIATPLYSKAFKIGLVLILGQAARGSSLALFLAILAAAAVAWALLGEMLHGQRTAGLALLSRVSAGWLGLLGLR